VVQDFHAMKCGAVHWGWPHCVQQTSITQTAIDRQQTLIAWEAMHRWSPDGDWQMHVFNKNNELAGYAGVLHAMSLAGIDGNYGRPIKATVFSFGSVSQGAIRALQARGVSDITVFTPRDYEFTAEKLADVDYLEFQLDENGKLLSLRPDRHFHPFIEELRDSDIIVNGILQDTEGPLMFVPDGQTARLKPGCLIVDVSCDEGMGFSFAQPTSFDAPMLDVESVLYYAVDHTPSYLWNSASWEISKSLIPYLPVVIQGPESWKQSETIRRAIEIQDGVIQNPKILSFQKREAKYPHPVCG
jgi:alanine dehydrogenase